MSREIDLGSGSGIVYPDKRVFAFSPYECVVTGTSIGQDVIFTFSGKTLKRVTGSDNKITIELSTIFRSFFANTEIGIIDDVVSGTYVNQASKLVLKDKTVNVKIGSDTIGNDLIFDILFGALQQGESEETEETIYRFGNDLPLTITQETGSWIANTPATLYVEGTYGKDISVNALYADEKYSPYLYRGGAPAISLKTINVVEMSVCPESYYLRWIDRKTANYKYYNFLLGKKSDVTSNGATYNYPVNSLDATDGLYKNSLQTIKKISGETITVVEPSADYLQQKHIKTIFDSPKVWLYIGDNQWLEVNTSESTFEVERNPGKKEIQVNVVMPQKYNIEL